MTRNSPCGCPLLATLPGLPVPTSPTWRVPAEPAPPTQDGCPALSLPLPRRRAAPRGSVCPSHAGRLPRGGLCASPSLTARLSPRFLQHRLHLGAREPPNRRSPSPIPGFPESELSQGPRCLRTWSLSSAPEGCPAPVFPECRASPGPLYPVPVSPAAEPPGE